MRNRFKREQEFSRRLRYKQHLATRHSQLRGVVRRGLLHPFSLWQRYFIAERDRLLTRASLLERILVVSCLRVVPCAIGALLAVVVGWIVGKQLGDVYSLSPAISHLGSILFAALAWCALGFVERVVHLDAIQWLGSAAEIARYRIRTLVVASCGAIAAIASSALVAGFAYENWSFLLFGSSIATAGTFSWLCWRAAVIPGRPAKAGELSGAAVFGAVSWILALIFLMLLLGRDSTVAVALPKTAPSLLLPNSFSSWCVAVAAMVSCSLPAIRYAAQLRSGELHRRIVRAIRDSARLDPATKAETPAVVVGDRAARRTMRRAMNQRFPSPRFYVTELLQFRTWLIVVMTLWTGALVAFFAWIAHHSPGDNGQPGRVAIAHLILMTVLHEGPLVHDVLCRFRTHHFTAARLFVELQKCGLTSLVWQLPLIVFCIGTCRLATQAEWQIAASVSADLALCLVALIALRTLVCAATLAFTFVHPPATFAGDIFNQLAPPMLSLATLCMILFLIGSLEFVNGSMALCALTVVVFTAAFLVHRYLRRPIL